jgi:hypothetical protein
VKFDEDVKLVICGPIAKLFEVRKATLRELLTFEYTRLVHPVTDRNADCVDAIRRHSG